MSRQPSPHYKWFWGFNSLFKTCCSTTQITWTMETTRGNLQSKRTTWKI